jgi:hypothetical protein
LGGRAELEEPVVTTKVSGPPKGQPWIWITQDVLCSPAWQNLGINARRLIDFLMIEHMSHGGKHNGYLLAPREQLETFGIGRRLITGAIKEARTAGLIEVKPGVGRRPSTFALRWLPVAVHQSEQQAVVAVHEGELQGCTKVNNKACSSARRCTATAQNKGSRKCTPYKNSYQDRSYITGVYSAEAQTLAADSAVNLNGASHHPAGKSRPAQRRQALVTPRGTA